MFKKIGVIVCVIALSVSFVEAKKKKNLVKHEPLPEIYQTVWEKTFGGNEDDVAQSIVSLTDGESAIAGTCRSFGAQATDICLMRMDPNGEIEWKLLLGGAKDEEARQVIKSQDGNLLVFGRSKSYSKNDDFDFYLAKVSTQGEKIWEKTFGGDRDEVAGGIALASDGSMFVVGDSNSYKRKYNDIYIAKLEKNGEMITSYMIGSKKEDSAQAITRTKDGNMVLVGYRETGRAGDRDFLIMKLDTNGNKIWSKTYGEYDIDRLNSVVATDDGGIVATGSTRSYKSALTDLSVMKLDTNGMMAWHKIYGFKYYEYGNGVTKLSDGGFMVSGGTSSLGKGDHDLYMLAFDKTGAITWSHVYGGRDKDSGTGIAQLDDGSVVSVGNTASFGRSKEFYMIKVKKKP
ncbi:MAG: hypothetical protein RL113_136 [Pseudomonadota bacterium]